MTMTAKEKSTAANKEETAEKKHLKELRSVELRAESSGDLQSLTDRFIVKHREALVKLSD
jgi:hypothetical protein